MNPSRASSGSDLRQQLGADEAVASYVSEMKRRHAWGDGGTPAEHARRIIDESMQGSLTALLYESREDGLK